MLVVNSMSNRPIGMPVSEPADLVKQSVELVKDPITSTYTPLVPP